MLLVFDSSLEAEALDAKDWSVRSMLASHRACQIDLPTNFLHQHQTKVVINLVGDASSSFLDDLHVPQDH